jgi:hypothetical protein
MPRRLTDTDKDFILYNYKTMTDKEMSKTLNCSTRTIERHRSSSGLLKKHRKEDRPEASHPLKNEGDKKEFYKQKFILSPRGRKLKEQVSTRDWPNVVSEWCEYHIQLDDITYTEQNTIEQIIIIKLRMDRNQTDYKESSSLRDTLMGDILVDDIKDLDLTNPDEAMIYEKIYSASIKMSDLNKEYRDMLDKSTKLQETLNVTRKQREEKGRVGADTFFDLCRKFESQKSRDEEGRMAELLRIATEKNSGNLREAIEFLDGEIAPQLLDEETINLMEKKNE